MSRKSPSLVLASLAVLALACFALALSTGSVALDLGSIARALLGFGDETQQAIVRQLVSQRVDLARFKRKSPLPLPPPVRRDKSTTDLDDEPVE